MMDGLEPMKGKGLIFNYVDEVKLKNVTFKGLKDKEIETVEVNKISK